MAGNAKKRRKETPAQLMGAVRRAAKRQGGACLTKEYRARSAKWRFQCERGHRFTAHASKVLEGASWCGACRKLEMVERVHLAAQKDGGVCLNKRWKPTVENWSFRCRNGHRLRKRAQQVLHGGLFCQHCEDAENYKKVTESAEAIGGTVVTRSFIGLTEKWDFKCKDGHRIERVAEDVLRDGFSCEVCVAEDVANRVKERCKALGWRCLAGSGKSTSARWRFQCENGHEIEMVAGKLLYGEPRCPDCKREDVIKRIHAAAAEKGGECLTTEYRATSKSWSFRCEKGHKFSRTGSGILYQGAWCPKCLGRSPEDMLEKLQRVAKERGGKCLSTTYKKGPEKMQFECGEGHQWESLASLVLFSGNWCPTCHKLPSGEFLKKFEKALRDHEGAMVNKSLGKLNEAHWFRCKKGHTFEQLPTKLLSAGHWCPTCSYEERAEMQRLGIEAARKAAEEMGGECLAKEFKNAKQKAWWRCEEGHEWEAKFTSIIHGGTWCPECWDIRRRGPREEPMSEARPLGIEDCQALAARHNGLCLTGYYVNHMHEMAWRCERKHEWMASLHKMEQRENFCVECYEIDRKQAWLQKAHEFAGEYGGRCLSTEWVSAQKKLKWKCEKGHEFETCWNNAIVGPFCGQCAKEEAFQKSGAGRLKEIADEFGGRWIPSAYKGMRERYEFECANGCRFRVTPASAKRSWHRHCQCC